MRTRGAPAHVKGRAASRADARGTGAAGWRQMAHVGRTVRVAGPGAALVVAALLNRPRRSPGPGDEAQREQHAEREAAHRHPRRRGRVRRVGSPVSLSDLYGKKWACGPAGKDAFWAEPLYCSTVGLCTGPREKCSFPAGQVQRLCTGPRFSSHDNLNAGHDNLKAGHDNLKAGNNLNAGNNLQGVTTLFENSSQVLQGSEPIFNGYFFMHARLARSAQRATVSAAQRAPLPGLTRKRSKVVTPCQLLPAFKKVSPEGV